MLSRIDVSKLNSVLGVRNAIQKLKASSQPNSCGFLNDLLKPKSMSHSRSQELVFLKWVDLHHASQVTNFQTKFSDFLSLNDSLAFCSLMKAHISVFIVLFMMELLINHNENRMQLNSQIV